MDPPHPVVLDGFTGRVERQTVDLTQPVDFVPVFANVHVLKRDMIGPVGAPARAAAAWVRALTREYPCRSAPAGAFVDQKSGS
jgi:hypothetical protein